ncbi:hypothetical protein [Streptomyces sp. IBSBF 2806]|uniref:hypothetical protein n=1 Tax=Streptomyces sp. IBSBF 2806 TaxID=2903529 RepID=UPI002FDBEEA9
MSRLSREKKRDQQPAGGTAAVVATLDVHVRGGGTATISGVPVVAAEGEEIQRAVLGHLHRIALATGHAVLAAVRDERIGYVVPLRVEPDGSSHFTAEPLRTPTAPPAPAPMAPPAPAPTAPPAPAVTPAPVSTATQESASDRPSVHSVAAVSDEQQQPSLSASSSFSSQPRDDRPTHSLRQVSEPVRDAAPTFALRAVPEPEPAPEPEPDVQDDAPSLGTVTAPTGVFGPPPALALKHI